MPNSYTDESGTFLNKLGITDAQQLQEQEYLIASQVTREIEAGRLPLAAQGYGLARQQEIHKHLLQDVYGWAGEVRTVPSARRTSDGLQSRFSEPDTIVSDWRALELRIDAFVAASSLSFEQKCDELATIYVELNQIHAFPDGNGRSAQVFIKQIAREQGVELDYSRVQPQDWNRAAALSANRGRLFEHVHFIPVPSDCAPIRKVFADIATPVNLAKQWGASPGKGQCIGKVVALSNIEVIQEAGRGKHVVWDRQNIQGAKLTIGESVTICESGKVSHQQRDRNTLGR